MTTYTITQEQLDTLMNVSHSAYCYKMLKSLQPNTHGPCDFKSWISEAYREPHTTFTIHNMEVAFCAGRVAAHGVKP